MKSKANDVNRKLRSVYSAAGAAPGFPLLANRPAKNCCTILERQANMPASARFHNTPFTVHSGAQFSWSSVRMTPHKPHFRGVTQHPEEDFQYFHIKVALKYESVMNMQCSACITRS